jgi:subtilisin family serine protease
VNGVAAQLTGAQIVELAGEKGILAITLDSKVRLSVYNNGFSSSQSWVSAVSASDVWSGYLRPPAIAVVDSGVQSCRADFGDTGYGCSSRVIKSVTMTGLLPNSSYDGRGHGTLVAGLAAGSRDGYAGVAPTAPIVSIDVMDDNGMAMTSDVIAAADWILANKSRYNNPRRQLLAPVDGARQLHVRPPEQGGREALVQRRRRRRGSG